jgi:transcriptional regulator with XRE-family HTH domain
MSSSFRVAVDSNVGRSRQQTGCSEKFDGTEVRVARHATVMCMRRLNTRALYDALDRRREQRQLTWQQVADEMTIADDARRKLAAGTAPDISTVLTMAGWLGESLDTFVDGPPIAAPEPDLRSLKEAIEQAVVDREHARESVLRAAYDQLQRSR